MTVTFDGNWPDPGSAAIWEHFLVEGPSQDGSRPWSHDRVAQGVTRSSNGSHVVMTPVAPAFSGGR